MRMTGKWNMRIGSLFVLAISLLFCVASCDEERNFYDYLSTSYIDTVLAADTIQNHRPVDIVHVYPGGCNYFERFESRERGDTLELSVLYHFYFRGAPCVHGTGLDTTSYGLHFTSGGYRHLVYWRNESHRVVQDVFVE
jgi:hypothetical protein